MKSKLKTLTLAVMLGAAGIGVIGCTPIASSSDASSSSVDLHPDEEKETSSSDSRAFNIWFDNELTKQNGKLEIAVGQRYLLWKHISVPKGTYVLEAKTDNVTIDNHVIEATATGAFKVSITATSTEGKKTTKTLTGTIITEEKAAFNELWNKMVETDDYKATGDVFGETIHYGSEKAYEYLAGTNTVGKSVYYGNVYDSKTSHWYSYGYVVGDANLTFNGGYGLSAESFGLVAGLNDIGTYQWTELTDKSGNGTGKFYLEDSVSTSGSYKYSDLVSPLFDTIYGSLNNVWDSILTRGLSATGVVATVDSGDNSITFTPVDNNLKEIDTYKSSSSTYSLLTVISGIGETTNSYVDEWIKTPKYPEAVDISGLKSAFKNIEDKKNYTMTTLATWMDTTTGNAVETPESLATYFEPFISTVMVADDMKVDVVNYSSSNQWNFLNASGLDSMFLGDDGEWTMPSAGDVTTSFIKDGRYSQAKGTVGDDKTITYGDVATGNALTSLWGHYEKDGESTLPLVTEGLGDVLDTVSFTSTKTVSGANAYYFNTCGDDFNDTYKIASWSTGAIVGGICPWIYAENSDFLALNMKAVMSYGFGRVGAELYFNTFFAVENDEISLYEVLTYDSSTAFVMTTTWSDIGTTKLDAASQALLA